MLKKSFFLLLLDVVSLVSSIHLVQAQSNQTCNLALNDVADQIYQAGTSVNVIESDDADNEHLGNPTLRKTKVVLILGKSNSTLSGVLLSKQNNSSNQSIENILNSAPLQQEWADYLVKNCQNLAVVAFGQADTDWINEYAIQADGSTKPRECLDPESESEEFLPWDRQFCL